MLFKGTLICPKCNKIYAENNGIISFIDEKIDKKGYKKNYFIALREFEKRHFWFRGRNKIILFFIKKYCQEIIKREHKMLEIGCGNGSVLRYLRSNGIECQGGDLFLEGLIYLRKKARVLLYQIDALNLPFRGYFDIIGMFDVAEHVEEDEELFKEAYKALKSHGKMLITVPANKKLWGRYDELAFHKRRYTKKELVKKLENSGFAIERISYFVSLLFPILLLFRRINKKKSKNLNNQEFLKKETKILPFFNTVFLWILEIEGILIHFIGIPFGSSLIAVARKE
jgi:SAM-dependent methyltransferase